ncbi:Lrp/AsnC ligand binding domain-containing protein [Candidatus Bathyarchaeota archaeon]|nr:Lrp/AsnC ligand binding domain-containing protein [Candidatus Bathyarchaeota archaeon]
MSLTCKVGSYNKVLEELLKLKIPKGDIFLLFGPTDILIQFNELQDIDEFSKKWFTPIRTICCKDDLITKTMTFIVVKEGVSFAEEPFAFMFMNIRPQHLENAQEALLQIEEVISSDIVFGPYDLIVPVRAKDHLDLKRVVSKIHEIIPGIEGAATIIVAMFRI